jgi:hypothetical protein
MFYVLCFMFYGLGLGLWFRLNCSGLAHVCRPVWCVCVCARLQEHKCVCVRVGERASERAMERESESL